MSISTADLSDQFPEDVKIVLPVLGQMFMHYGAFRQFSGMIATIKCFEDNSKVAEQVKTSGNGRVLVVDGEASMRCSLLGDQLAETAAVNGWSGILINGCLRDVELLAEMPIGVMALASVPRKTIKRDLGEIGLTLNFADSNFVPGHFLYADETGIILAANDLLA